MVEIVDKIRYCYRPDGFRRGICRRNFYWRCVGGLISIGGLSGVLLFSLEGLSIGSIAVGGLAIGFLTAGGLAFGMYSYGGCAIAARIAAGGYARGTIAIGEQTRGMIEFSLGKPVMSKEIRGEILNQFPGTWRL